jgi:hypothetical protein
VPIRFQEGSGPPESPGQWHQHDPDTRWHDPVKPSKTPMVASLAACAGAFTEMLCSSIRVKAAATFIATILTGTDVGPEFATPY